MRKTINPKKPKPDLQAMARHCRLLFRGRDFTYQTFDKGGAAKAKPGYKHVPAGTDLGPVLQRLKTLNTSGLDIAVVPNLMNGQGRKATDCKAIRYLFLDLDGGNHTLKSVFKLLPIKPHLVVESSAGRFHAYWRVKGMVVEDFKPLMLALAANFGGDANVADPSRCMRLAGTCHHKRGEVSRLVYPAPEVKRLSPPIAAADFMEQMKVSVEASPKDTAESPATAEKESEHACIESKLTLDDVHRLLRYIDAGPRGAWFKVGKALHSRWPTAEGYELWTKWSETSSKFNAAEQHKTWESFDAKGGTTLGTLVHLARQSAPELPTADELSFALALVRHFTGELGFDSSADTWWRFDGHHWKRLANQTQALQAVRDAVALWSLLHAPEAVRELNKTAVMAAALRRAALETDLNIKVELFDANPEMLGVLNGVVNLRTGEFRAGRPGDFITRRVAVHYDADAKCPAFKAFLLRICCGDKMFARFVARVLGLCLTGETKEQKLFFFIGSGGNGKGVLMNTIQNLFGDYAVTLTAKELMKMNTGDANAAAPAIARLKGRRLMLASELVKGKPLDEAFVKQLSGGDKMTARKMYEGEYTEFRPEGKLIVLCNDAPPIPFGDEALWRRIIMMPAEAKLTDSAEDKALPQTLAAEAPGILNMFVRHAGIYLSKGLGSCAKVEAATQAVRNRADTVKAWIDDCCREEARASYPAEEAQKAYRAHASALGVKPLGPQAFSSAMARLGFPSTRRGVGVRYQGVRPLKTD